MLYYIAELLIEHYPALRLLRYTTFRTIMAILTAFFIALLLGRPVINWLFKKNFRDVVRDYTVLDIDSKSGTPTMGGVLILLSISISIALWCDFSNPYLYYLLGGMIWFAILGLIDDLAKVRYRDSDKGLSRGAKYLLQAGFGLLFSIFFLIPQTTPLPHPAKTATCKLSLPQQCKTPCRTDADCSRSECAKFTQLQCRGNLCQAQPISKAQNLTCTNTEECIERFGKYSYCFQPWRYRVTKTEVIAFRPSQLYVPFYKYPLFDLGWLYAIVIILFIIYSANAVNFADGLDGLAAVPTMFSFAVFGIYAYLFGNAIIASYLWVPFLPGASEIAVFSGAVVGSLLGFLWFNAYPAEVFMGDTGSMALGGILGVVIVLLKQEFLFFLVGGIFLLEIISVMLQDWLGIQFLGRRILYRAPIHHTFQYRGMSEPKIAIRFWIVAGILSLIALSALKIR